IRLGESLCYFERRKDINTENIKQDNESPTLSTEDSESSNDDDESPNIDDDEQNIEQQLLIDTVALDEAIADADAIADREV
ncbi:unnamed protein product, partial [Rotaria magnacalcarata]